MRMLLAAIGTALVLAPTAGAAGTLSVSPDPVALGSTFTVSGCGYTAPGSISFEVVGPRKSGIDYFTSGEPLTDSCFSEQWTAWWSVAGDYSINSYTLDAKGMRKKEAVVKFTVV
ncbi:MAG TPA: hypothetical protein VFJ78_06760 [Gaiellaceae bacterium]|nr:hypothetical protein [Gaiellaceae bacterium]